MKSAFDNVDVAVDNGGDYGSDLDDELLHDVVQYSSSSVDRSSIGSIPWADDAIKQNQLDWERVERMLMGEESLPNTETELRNEILEWQRKFPQLLDKRSAKHRGAPPTKAAQSFDSSKTNFDLDSLSNLSLNSSDDVGDVLNYDDDEDDDFPTPTTQQWPQPPTQSTMQIQVPTSPTRRAPTRNSKPMKSRVIGVVASQLMQRDFCVNSIPLTLSKRQSQQAMQQRPLETSNEDHSSTSSSAGSRRAIHHPSSQQAIHQQHQQQQQQQQRQSPKPNYQHMPQRDTTDRLRMPPILNVLETKRRFCGLASNRSFVQLTQVQQAKSAVVTAAKAPIETAARCVYGSGRNKSAWHVPLAATAVSNRFFNNRNAIILPALNLQRIGTHHATSAMIATNDEMATGTTTTTTAITTNSDSAAERTLFQHFGPRLQHFNATTTTATTTPSSGVRSISAAVHPRSNLHAFYLPYSAAKFKSFK